MGLAVQVEEIRCDHKVILEWIKPETSVLDLGCGDGALLDLLVRKKRVRAQGIEIDEQAIYQCVARGLSVMHEDIDHSLNDYSDRSFDYVILNESLQQVLKLDQVLQDSLRVGRHVIVGFPNFAHYGSRLQIFFRGRTPVTPALPYKWHDTPNLHFLSISDFRVFCRERNFQIDATAFLSGCNSIRVFANLFARTGLFMISRSI
jgi:methionine biosynthesis protein MetW